MYMSLQQIFSTLYVMAQFFMFFLGQTRRKHHTQMCKFLTAIVGICPQSGPLFHGMMRVEERPL